MITLGFASDNYKSSFSERERNVNDLYGEIQPRSVSKPKTWIPYCVN